MVLIFGPRNDIGTWITTRIRPPTPDLQPPHHLVGSRGIAVIVAAVT